MRSLVAIAAVVLAGCGGLEPLPAEPDTIVFTPDPVLARVAAEWAERWANATGKNIVIGPGGIPIHAVPEVMLNPEDDVCGATLTVHDKATGHHIRTELVEIAYPDRPRGCAGWGYTLGHEMGHSLGGTHSCGGILAGGGLKLNEVHVIDACSLESVCAELNCQWMSPELVL